MCSPISSEDIVKVFDIKGRVQRFVNELGQSTNTNSLQCTTIDTIGNFFNTIQPNSKIRKICSTDEATSVDGKGINIIRTRSIPDVNFDDSNYLSFDTS